MSNLPIQVNIGELSKPATVLIKKISDAIVGIARPWQIRRVAEAEADAETIKAVAQIEITELQRRAVRRLVIEQARMQNNMESITQAALPQVNDQARPQEVEDDWLTNFFEKCRMISDQEMQIFWAKILAGEANAPGKFAKRTINLIASFDKSDAERFNILCSFIWELPDPVPLVYDLRSGQGVYHASGITYDEVKHLEDAGLVFYESSGVFRLGMGNKWTAFYQGQPVLLERESPDSFPTGYVLLTKAGRELSSVCPAKPQPDFKNYVIDRWRRDNFKVAELDVESRGSDSRDQASKPAMPSAEGVAT